MAAGRVALASDHGGFALKEAIEAYLSAKNVDTLDVGTHSTDACDYPVFARAAAEAVASGRAWRGIVVDGAGIGSCMVANKVPGARAGMAFNAKTARNAREHNDANVLTLGSGYVDEATAFQIVDVFLSTECTVDRHQRRVTMIDALDGGRPEPARSDPPMASQGNEYEALVQKISKVLSANPALLGGVVASAPAPVPTDGSSCVTCTSCGQCASKTPDAVRKTIAAAPDSRVTGRLGIGDVPHDIAKLIDHTLLKPEATYDQIDQLCNEALLYGFASVCVNPMHVQRCAQHLRNAGPLVCTVIGFPLGATPRQVKALEARQAIRDGARELDMVLAIGALKSGDHQHVLEDIRLLAEVAHESRAILKVIIETALLTDDEKRVACELSRRARADFVKTSTGFSKGGATAHDIALMAQAVDYKLGVKASGGVGSAADAQQMVAAGATRIGASVGVKIVKETTQGRA